MSGSDPIGGFPDFLWSEARFGNTRSDVEGDLGEGQLGRGPELREPDSCPVRGFTGPEVWLQKGSTWAVCSSLTFPVPRLFLSFCQRLHVFGFSDGREDIFVLFVFFFLK